MSEAQHPAADALARGQYMDFIVHLRHALPTVAAELLRGIGVDPDDVDLSMEHDDAELLREIAAVVWDDDDELLAIEMLRHSVRAGCDCALPILIDALNWVGALEQTIPLIEDAVSRGVGDPRKLAGFLGEAQFEVGAGATEDTRGLLEHAYAAHPEFGLTLARVLLARHELDAARRLLASLVDEGAYGAAILLGNLLCDEFDEVDAAEAAYRAGIASGDAYSAHNLAVMLLDRGEPERAREFHELAITLGDPSALE